MGIDLHNFAFITRQQSPDGFTRLVSICRLVEKIEPIVAQYKQAVATYEKQPGSYAARNQGISLAKGEILAFTDSDCIPAKDWLENGVAALKSNPNCGIVGGQVELFYQDPKHLTAVELYENYGAFTQQQNIEQFRFGVTANLFTFKSVFEPVGNFNSQLKSNGDRSYHQCQF